MNNRTDPDSDQGRWRNFWRRPKSKWLLGIPIGAWLMFVVGGKQYRWCGNRDVPDRNLGFLCLCLP